MTTHTRLTNKNTLLNGIEHAGIDCSGIHPGGIGIYCREVLCVKGIDTFTDTVRHAKLDGSDVFAYTRHYHVHIPVVRDGLCYQRILLVVIETRKNHRIAVRPCIHSAHIHVQLHHTPFFRHDEPVLIEPAIVARGENEHEQR